jgi:hypothetical protein
MEQKCKEIIIFAIVIFIELILVFKRYCLSIDMMYLQNSIANCANKLIIAIQTFTSHFYIVFIVFVAM